MFKDRYWKQQERNNSYKQEILNKTISLFLSRNLETKSTIGWYRNKNIVNYEVCIWQKCPAKNKGEIKTVTDKQMLNEFVITRPTLQAMLKVILKFEVKGNWTVIQG